MGKRDEEDEGFDVGKVICLHATASALKFRMLEDMTHMKMGQEFWVGHDQVHDDSDVYQKGDEGQLKVLSWLARERGWEDA